MVLQISLIDYLMNETCRIANACCICCRIRTVECQMELEVREILFYLQEVFQIEHFVQRTCTVEVVHGTICDVQCLCQVHDLCT